MRCRMLYLGRRCRTGGDCSTSVGTNQGERKERGWTNCRVDCYTSAGTSQGGRKEHIQTPPRPELIEAGGRSVDGRIVKARGAPE